MSDKTLIQTLMVFIMLHTFVSPINPLRPGPIEMTFRPGVGGHRRETKGSQYEYFLYTITKIHIF